MIEDEALPRGQALPTSREVAAVLAVDYKTVHRAMSELVREGLIGRHRGRGTFVLRPQSRSGVVALVCSADVLSSESSGMGREVMFRVQKQLRRKGQRHRLYLLGGADSSNEAFLDLMDDLEQGRVAGLVVLHWRPYMEPAWALAERRRVPALTFGSADHGRLPCSVHIDYTSFLEEATQDLARCGRRRLGVIYNIRSNLLPTRSGMARLITRAGGRVSQADIVGRPCTCTGGYEAADQIDLATLDGLIVTDDVMATGVEQWLHERGLAVPGDLAVASLWDSTGGVRFALPFIRYASDRDRIIREGTQLLAEAMAGRRIADPHRHIAPHRVDALPIAGMQEG